MKAKIEKNKEIHLVKDLEKKSIKIIPKVGKRYKIYKDGFNIRNFLDWDWTSDQSVNSWLLWPLSY